MLIEETTTYVYKLKYLDNPSFDKVENLAKKLVDELPRELVDDLYSQFEFYNDHIGSEQHMLADLTVRRRTIYKFATKMMLNKLHCFRNK